jgi:hypothetical protein
MYEAATNHPAEIAGMAFFLTLSNTTGTVFEVKGKVSADVKGFVSFKMNALDIGFYSYSISVRSDGYSQTTLEGTYVVQA